VKDVAELPGEQRDFVLGQLEVRELGDADDILARQRGGHPLMLA